MARIKSKDTKPEILVRKFLFSRGFRFRIHVKHLPGKPDLVLRKYNTVVFVHGCFWHAHKGCRYNKIPKSNPDFWQNKISTNVKRDKQHITTLKDMGWNVIVIWECELGNKQISNTMEKVIAELTDSLK